MYWSGSAILLLLTLSVAVTAQRGSSRYKPDQPKDESLSTENHRFRSRSRDDTGEVQRGEGRRGTTHVQTDTNERLSPEAGRSSRGRTEEPRQYHSIPSRREQQLQQKEERMTAEVPRQHYSRREPERARHAEPQQSQRYRSRDSSAEVTESSRHSSRGRLRGEAKEVQTGRRAPAVATRFPSRTGGESDTQSANLEPVRNRAGLRGRTPPPTKNIPSRKKNISEQTKYLPKPVPSPSTDRILSRADVGDEDLFPTGNQDQASEIKFTPDPLGSVELPAKTNDVTENNQELSAAEGENTKVINKDSESNIDTVINEESKSIAIAKTVTTPYENVNEFPSNLNDVEESNRASRRLDTDITDSEQFTRGRSHSSEESGRRRPLSEFRKGRQENNDRASTRGRSSEVKSRNRAEEQRETRTQSRPSEDQHDTRSRKIGSSRASRLEGSVRNQGLEETSRNRDQDGRGRSELTRSSARLQAVSRTRGNSDDTSRSKSLDSRGRQNSEIKAKTPSEYTESNQKIVNRNNPETQGLNRNTEVRSRRPSTESFSTNDSKRRPEKNSLSQRERTPELPKKDINGVRPTHRYSAKIPDASQIRADQKPSNSLISRGRTKDLPNFRSRPKLNDNIATSEEKLDVTPTSAPLPEVQTVRKSLLNNLQEEKNEVILNTSTERVVAPTVKSLASLLHRKPGGNRPRGAAKGPKLEEETISGEVRDDDNYPEVYKQLKKSGTSPKEILALLKARKATQGKLDISKPKFTQPDASLKSSRREQKLYTEEIKTSQEEDEYKPHFQTRFRPRNRETDDNVNQRVKSKLPSRNNEKNDVSSNIKDPEIIPRFRPSLPRSQTEFNQKQERHYKKSEEVTEKSKHEREKSKERKYLPSKRFEYQTLNRKKPSSFVSTEATLQQDSPITKPDEENKADFDGKEEDTENRQENALDDQIIQSLKEDYTINRQNNPQIEFKSEIPNEDQTEKSKKTYVPRSRDKEIERFKARTEKTFDFVSVETPIKPNYKLYNRNDGTTFRRRSFTTPTSEGEDLTVNVELKNSLRPRNRPTYIPPKKSYTKQATTSIPLSRYRARKASLSKYNNKEDLKVDNSEDHKLTFNSEVDDHEDLRPRFNDLSVDSLVSESEHATYTTESSTAIRKTTRNRPNYKESFIQRIPPRGKAIYTRPTFRPSITTTTEGSTSFRPEPTTLGVESLTSPDLSDSTENEVFSTTSSYILNAVPTVDDFTPSITITEETTLEMTSMLPTTISTTTTKPTTKKITTTRRTTKHTTKKPKTTKPTTKKITTTTTQPTTTLPTTTTEQTTVIPTTIPTTTTTIKSTTKKTKGTTKTRKPTTTTTRKPTTTTTRKPTTTTTRKPTTTTTRKPTTTTTRKPTTTTTRKPTTTTTRKPTTTTTRKPTTTRKLTTTTTTKATRKPTTKSTTTVPTSVHTAVPRKVQKTTTISTPISSTLNSIISTKQPNFLSTIAYLAHNFSVTPTDYNPVNTADFRTTSRPTESTTAMSNSEHYVVYGLLPNNNVVRKVVKTTKAPIDLPFIIYGLYPNGTIVRRFPNGTIIPDETEEENEVIGNVDPESHEELENVVKKDSPLSYLYPPGMERPPSQNTLTAKLSEGPSTTASTTTFQTTSSAKPTTTTKPATKSTTKKKHITTAATTTKKLPTTTRKPSTTTKKTPTTTTKKPTTTTKKPTTTTTKKPTTTTTEKPSTTTTKPTSTTTKKSTSTSRKPSTTTTKLTSTTVKTTTTTKPSTTVTTIKSTTKDLSTTAPTTTQKSKKSKATKSSTTVSSNEKKLITPMIVYAETSSDSTTTNDKISTKPTTPLSDIEIISNLLSQGIDGRLSLGTTESSEDLANKVIQLAIERAQKSTESSENKGGTSSSDLQSLSSTVSPIVKEGTGGDNLGETKNKTGKISLWVIPPDESTTANSLEAPVSKNDEAVLNSLLSTPSTLENLSLSDQLLLADVLSSTAFPQTTAKKKKKKRPKTTTTTTTTQSPFPVLQYLFGRNRGGGLFQRGLFRGGGLGGLAALQAGSAPQIQESPGGIFQNQNDEFPTEQVEIPAEPQQENPQEGTRLVNAAINVSRAVSQFMGFVIQGAAQSFQNYLSTRTRALADAFTYPPAPN